MDDQASGGSALPASDPGPEAAPVPSPPADPYAAGPDPYAHAPGPDGGAPYGGAPYGGAPYGGAPHGGAPYGGAPYGGAPYGGPPPGGPYAHVAGYEGAAIHAPGYAAAPPQRSGAASTIGILGIIFGVLITLGGGLQVGCRALIQNLQAPTARNTEIIRLLQLEMGIWGVMTIMSIALIVVGVGVWRHRETARKAMVIWSGLALAVIAGRMATQAFVMQPRAEKYQQEMMAQHGSQPGPEAEQILKVGRAWAIFGDLVVWAPFPLVSLILLTRRTVRDRCS